MVALRVDGLHPRRPAALAHPVLARRQHDGHHAPRILHHQLVALDAVDPADGKVEQQVHDPRQLEPLQRLGERRADAFKRRYLGEQRMEDVGTHDLGSSCQRKNVRSNVPRR